MKTGTDKIKIIFGLKLRQQRMARHWSLQELASRVGLSVSYLNEIEKGKKYPKSEKIIALADCFDTSYDELVSLKVDQSLEPIADTLNSTILKDLPLEMFGIEPSDFVDLMSRNPNKISAFINTLKEISRTYDIKNSAFFEAVLRSYQEMNDNYFPEIEQLVINFKKEQQWVNTQNIRVEELKQVLKKTYQYRFVTTNDETIQPMAEVQAVYLGNNRFWINPILTFAEQAYILAQELAYRYLNLQPRTSLYPLPEAQSFEAVFNQFKAQYFAAALLVNKEILIGRLTYLLASPKWDAQAFLAVFNLFEVSTKVFMARVISVLAGHFKLNNLFLLGMKKNINTQKINTTQQMHLRQLHSPHGYARNEHYCRRWLALSIFQKLGKNLGEGTQLAADTQMSNFEGSEQGYFVLTLAQWNNELWQNSDTIGFVIDTAVKEAINFIGDPAIVQKTVNQTCERCGIMDCQERIAEPTVFNEKVRQNNIVQFAEKLGKSKLSFE